MIDHHHPSLDHLKMKSRIIKSAIRPSSSSSSTNHPHRLIRSRPTSILSFILQIFICYILLAYFYFCPIDPTQNPFVCRNLAQLHWSLEPHLSPYLIKFDHHLRLPIQSRIDRKLRPIYLGYLLPTWNQISPHLSHLIQRSTLLDRFHRFRSHQILPFIDHLQTRYRLKLAPSIDSLIHRTHRTYSILRTSKLIRSIKSHYLPHLNRSLNRFIIRPIHHKILPYLYRLYLRTIHPILIRSFDRTYQYLILDQNVLKRQLRNIKRSYRIKLLRPLKSLHEIYIRPQITKIVLKLDEYQTRPNHTSSVLPVDRIKNSDQEPLDRSSSQPNPVSIVHPHDHPSQLEPKSSTQASQPTPLKPVDPTPDQPITGGSSKEPNQSSTLDTLTTQEDEAQVLEDGFLDADDEMYDDEYLEDEDDDYLDDYPSIDVDNLTVDPDQFMDEISDEIASEVETQSQEELKPSARESKRLTAERTAAERQRLEALAAKGFQDMARLEKQVMSQFLIDLKQKRNPENLRQHDEFIHRDDRLTKIREESSKLIERITAWYQKNIRVESKSSAEKKSESELVIKKSKQKFLERLIEPHLLEIDAYGQREYKLEDEILKEAWSQIFQLYSEIQAELGHGLTWLNDVSYHDWAVYHRFRTNAEGLKTTMEGILNGVESEYLAEIPRPNFFQSIGSLRSTVEQINDDFQASLDRLHAAHLLALSHPTATTTTTASSPPDPHRDDDDDPSSPSVPSSQTVDHHPTHQDLKPQPAHVSHRNEL